MALQNKIKELEIFIISEIDIFTKMLQEADKETYTKDPILKRAIDKSLNDIILATVDLTANFLRIKKRVVPGTYKEIMLSAYEFAGDLATKMALLTRCRNETIHGYLKLNWENVKTVKNSKDDILAYVNMVKELARDGKK